MKLYEVLQWASGEHAHHAQPAARRFQEPDREDYVVVEVDLETLFQHLDPESKFDLESEEGGSSRSMKMRIPRAKEHWKSGGYMDPAMVGYNEHKNTFEVSDGRHRLAAAWQLGERKVPLIIPDYQLGVFKEKLGAIPK